MTTALSEFGGSLIEMRNLVTFIKAVVLEHNNATIKAAGIRVLVEVYKHMGPAILLPLLADVRAQIMTPIKKEFEKVANDKPASPTRGPLGPPPAAKEEVVVAFAPAAAVDIPRVDISNQINAALPGFANNDWQKRQEAMASIEAVLIEVKRIQPKGLSALMAPLKARLADSNINLIPLALNILGELASASGPTIESHMKVVMPSILACYANGKVNVRTACSQCLDKWVMEVGLDPILPYLPTALGTPSGRADLLGWISTKFAYVKKGDVKTLLKPAFQCYQDKTKEVRTVAETTLIELARKLTPKLVEGECSKMAPTILAQVRTLLKNNEAEIKKPLAPPVTSNPAPILKSKIPLPAGLSNIGAPATSSASPSSPGSSPRVTPSDPGAVRSDSIDGSNRAASSAALTAGPLLRNNKRMERELEELVWLFDGPIPNRYIDTLREQASACVTPDLLDRLFSNDAKSHNSAIGDFESAIDTQKDAVQDSLDVLLKWLSWRLFHTNTAILKRVVALFEHLIGTMDIWGHQLTELEAGSFIPLIIIRLPHLNETLQTSLRSVLQSVEQNFYPASKIFKLFMTIHRQWTGSQLPVNSRVEVLRYLAAFIRRQSLSVCDPAEAFPVFSSLLSEEETEIVIATLDLFSETGKQLTENEGLWTHISSDHHDLIKAYIASPGPNTLAKFKIGSGSPAPEVAVEKVVEKPAAASAPAPKKDEEEAPKSKAQPVLEKVQISKAAQFSLEIEKLKFEPLPASVDIPLPVGIAPTQLPAFISADPTPLLPSRQVSRTADVQKQQSKLLQLVQRWTSSLKSSDPNSVCEALGEIQTHLTQDIRTLIFHLEPLISSLVLVFKSAFSILSSIPDHAAALQRNLLLEIVGRLFVDESIAQYVAENSLRQLLPALIEAMLVSNDFSIAATEKEALIGKANQCTVGILNNGNRTSSLVALIGYLKEKTPKASEANTNANILAVTNKCIARLLKVIPTIMSKLKVPVVLHEVHLFFVAHPPHVVARVPNSPLETIKALIDKLVEVAGSSIVNQLGLIPHTLPPPAINWYLRSSLMAHNPSLDPTVQQVLVNGDQNPEVQPDLLAIVETSTSGSLLTFVSPKPRLPSSDYRLPAPASEEAQRQALKHVLQKIGKRETSTQGLVDLYWLKKDHPNLELDEQLRPTAAAFKDFVAQNMNRFAALDALDATDQPTSQTITAALTPAQEANAQLARLRALQSRLKLGRPSEHIDANSELDPAVLSVMAFGSTGNTASSTSSNINTSNYSGLGSTGNTNFGATSMSASSTSAAAPKTTASNFRERLRNASASTTSEPTAGIFDLPTLTVPPPSTSSSTPPLVSATASNVASQGPATSAPSTSATAAPNPTTISSSSASSNAISTTTSYPLPTLPLATPTSDSTPATISAPAKPKPSQIPLGPATAPAGSSGSSVESLRERLARIKNVGGGNAAQ